MADEHRRLLALACERAGLPLQDLWLRYFTLGGTAGLLEVEGYLHGLVELDALQRDMLAHAANEHFDELALASRVPYSSRTWQPRSVRGPLAALVELLEGGRLAPPEWLPRLVAAAGWAVGVQLGVFLVDYPRRRLVPLPMPGRGPGKPLGVDTTLAGRAFRLVETVAAEAGGSPRLWVPLLDGHEPLGVLEAVLPHGTDPRDPALREQCSWLSTLIGQLVTTLDERGDALDRARQQEPRTPASELIWALLPPLTAATDRFLLTGMLEPSDDVGGDAFDYTLSEHTATVAILDAMGHGLDAGLITAAGLAAYRSSRHRGDTLEGHSAAVDAVLAGRFATGSFLTGILGELDLTTGRLRYVAAGHPHPLLLRDGKVVRTLTGGRRLPFGLGDVDRAVGEESLQPGDWLVLYTDGITEARNAAGAFFGQDRLVDFLERGVAAGQPPPETVRRLVHAVVDFQDGRMTDDATVLLACWVGRDPWPGPPGLWSAWNARGDARGL